MATPDVIDRAEQLQRELGEDELRELLDALVDALGDREPLDVAVSLMARHEGLEGTEAGLRTWLQYLALQKRLVHELGGAPSQIVDERTRLAMRQAQLAGEAIATIWQEPMLEAKDAAVALGARPTNREKVRQYRDRSWLLGLPRGRGFLYPAFQFDLDTRDVYPEVRAVNQTLGALSDPWGVASWWVSQHARLSARPLDLVGTRRAGELPEAAEAVTEPVG